MNITPYSQYAFNNILKPSTNYYGSVNFGRYHGKHEAPPQKKSSPTVFEKGVSIGLALLMTAGGVAITTQTGNNSSQSTPSSQVEQIPKREDTPDDYLKFGAQETQTPDIEDTDEVETKEEDAKDDSAEVQTAVIGAHNVLYSAPPQENPPKEVSDGYEFDPDLGLEWVLAQGDYPIDDENTIRLRNGETFKIELSENMQKQVDGFVRHYEKYKSRYENVAIMLNWRVPPELIAAINFRENSSTFSGCLHDGTPLGEPVGGQEDGKVFYSWEDSAYDALRNISYTYEIKNNNLETCYQLAEAYNGTGYRDYHNMYSPYVFSGTDRYDIGMYVYDGHFDPDYKDTRPGIAVLLHALGFTYEDNT